MPKYQALKGMPDILPGEVERWQETENRTRHLLEAFGFEEIRTPVLEPAALFSHSVGEGSDIVHKQMLAFEDQGGRKVTLRPEMTASVVRAAVENGMLRREKTTRLYYLGPMFRAERPQRGRQRQFHQLGAEILGARPVEGDVEVLTLTHELLHFLGVPDFTLRVNHLGCEKDRGTYREALRRYFSERKRELCEDCLYRMEKNVLRCLDCKTEACQALIREAPALRLCSECVRDYDGVMQGLGERGISAVKDGRLVRGLDYYTGLVFEVSAGGELGAQDAVAAGGRYDGLIARLGGPEMGATGFAAGMERLLLAREGERGAGGNAVYVATLDRKKETERYFSRIVRVLYGLGRKARRDASLKTLGDHLKRADQWGLPLALIVGEDEIREEKVTVKDLRAKSQEKVALGGLAGFLVRREEEAKC